MTSFRRITDHRTSRPTFIADLVSIFRDARRGPLQFLLDLHDADEDRAFFETVVFPKNEVWIAEVAGSVGGFIAFAGGWVNHLYVAPRNQGRGIGTSLLDVAKQSHPSLQLWVFEANAPAIRFYMRRGFYVVERTDGAANEAKQPDMRLRWDAQP